MDVTVGNTRMVDDGDWGGIHTGCTSLSLFPSGILVVIFKHDPTLRRVLFPRESAGQPDHKRRKLDTGDVTATSVGPVMM